MLEQPKELIEQHIKTHTERSAQDRAAVSAIEYFLRSNGRINTQFAANDKWPNTDGTFEYVSDPDISRKPKMNFIVQIKGVHKSDDNLTYSLQSLGFPATIAGNVTLDPGILFVVFNPDIRNEERIFWKYMSVDFLNSIDFSKNSTTIHFTQEDEIINTDENILNFCEKLEKITSHHLFVNKLSEEQLDKDEIFKIIKACDRYISLAIDMLNDNPSSRDEISQIIIPRLNDLCTSALLLNSVHLGCSKPNVQLAYEQAQLNIKTKYLADFLRGLKYIDIRIPEEGQSERLMLKYYDFLWQIRKYMSETNNLSILKNLEKFPLNTDKLDDEYYEKVAKAVDIVSSDFSAWRDTLFYVQKKTPFFVGTERYYEITLQLADIHATKYNRITAYTKEDISTGYSISIGYEEATIELWKIPSVIKVITKWRVSIAPTCLNKLGKIMNKSFTLNSKYGEYSALMKFLTNTGMSLLDFIDLDQVDFYSLISSIYNETNTCFFKEVILDLRKNYSKGSELFGRNTIRYILIDLHEDTLIDVMVNQFKPQMNCTNLRINKGCYPFELKPYISNLCGSRTSDNHIRKIYQVTGNDKIKKFKPYLKLKNIIRDTGEIYCKTEEIASSEEIKTYNSCLDKWEKNQGFGIREENGYVFIESYENSTLRILNKLVSLSEKGNRGQKSLNEKFIKEHEGIITDCIKEKALRNVFVNSNILLIYGAAGTGKTTLINYISNLMGNSDKLFLTKTLAAKQNLERRIENPGKNYDFISIDSFTKKVNIPDYEIIFIDECSVIDNMTMQKFVDKIDDNTLLVLAGDINQIESIDFGNWFFYAKNIIKTNGANIELLDTWRTKEDNLLGLWNEVRNNDTRITEKLVIDGPFSKEIGTEIFTQNNSDEVVLCLNYDGKFGLNNINQYFQNANEQEAVIWKEWTYKKADKILFNDCERFTYLYNNLKGKIVDIEKKEDRICFTVDVDTLLTERQCRSDRIEYIDTIGDETRIRFEVYSSNENTSDSEDEVMNTVIPFQLAYAVSIHKAQGLEYESVKIVIPSGNTEKITKGIFYTAITRTKKNLKLYWSSETMKKIISGFSDEHTGFNSLEIIKNKMI